MVVINGYNISSGVNLYTAKFIRADLTNSNLTNIKTSETNFTDVDGE
jgi:uncharacterized protein YjbI with pentapeptide repeats